jgi:hypothetical protein
MIWARNSIAVAQGGSGIYTSDNTFKFPEPAQKVTLRVFNNDVIIEASETDPPVFEGTITDEMVVEKGFDSLVFAQDIYGLRVRCPTGSAIINIRAYG